MYIIIISEHKYQDIQKNNIFTHQNNLYIFLTYSLHMTFASLQGWIA